MSKTAIIEDDKGLLQPFKDSLDFTFEQNANAIIRSSPYTDENCLLDLLKYERPYQIIALALQAFTPIDPNYAFLSYEESFNLDQIREIVARLANFDDYVFPETKLYVIAFRSILKEEVKSSSAMRKLLADVDKKSFTEANDSGGLLKYWFGVPEDSTGQNLATCLWRSKKDAKLGGGSEYHRQAMLKLIKSYAYWHVEEFELTISENAASYNLIPMKREG